MPPPPGARRWTKRDAVRAARANQSIHAPAERTPAPSAPTTSGVPLHLRASIQPCMQWSGSEVSWPAEAPWPKPDAAMPSAGQSFVRHDLHHKLHAAHQTTTRTLPSSRRPAPVEEQSLSNYGLLPGSTNSAVLAAGAGGARAGGEEGGAVSDEAIDQLLAEGVTGAQFRLGWAPPPVRPKVHVPPRVHEEWELQVNDFDPITTFAIHQRKVAKWKAEAAMSAPPPPPPMPPIQPLPPSKHEEYHKMREQFGELLQPTSAWIRNAEWRQYQRAVSEDYRLGAKNPRFLSTQSKAGKS